MNLFLDIAFSSSEVGLNTFIIPYFSVIGVLCTASPSISKILSEVPISEEIVKSTLTSDTLTPVKYTL